MKKIICLLLFMLVLLFSMEFIVLADEVTEFLLDEIVVTASKYETPLSEVPVSMEVITSEEIKNSSAQNIADILKQVAGVQIQNYGGPAGQKTIYLRGAKAEQILVLLDGNPINSSQNGSVDLGQYLLDNIEKIEVLKGPASAIYGANALGGVINILTKKGNDAIGTNLNIDWGSYSTKSLVLSHGIKSEDTEIFLTVSKKNSDGHRKNSGLEQKLYSARIDHHIDKNNELAFTFLYNDSDKESPGQISSFTPNGTPEASQDDLHRNFALTWNNQAELKDTFFKVYYHEQINTYDNPALWNYSGPSIHKTNRKGLNFNQSYYCENNNISYGMELVEDKIDSNENGRHDFTTQSLYLDNKWYSGQKIILNTGIRYDQHEKFPFEISPRLGLVYKIKADSFLKLSIADAFRVPTFNDLYWPEDFYTVGNPNLVPEDSRAFELAFKTIKSNNNKLEINFFKRKTSNLINWATGPDGKWRPANIGLAETDGLELIVQKAITNNILFDFNYTYLDSENINNGDQLTDSNLSNIALTYSRSNYQINLSGKKVSGRIDDKEAYTVFDLTVIKDIAFRKHDYSLEFSINNLFNENYEVQTGYPMPGRNYMLEVSTDF